MKSTLTMVFSLAALAGCSSSGTGAPGRFTTSVDSSKPIGTLTMAEREQLCADANSFSSGSPTTAELCDQSGYNGASIMAQANAEATDAELQTACAEARDNCLTDPPTVTSTCNAEQAPPATCTVTVGEAVACLNDVIAATEAAFAAYPDCAEMTRAFITEHMMNPTNVFDQPSCAGLQAPECASTEQPQG